MTDTIIVWYGNSPILILSLIAEWLNLRENEILLGDKS